MCDNAQLNLQDCRHYGRENDLDLYIPKKTIHICDEENNIKILHIGTPNKLPTKTLLLIGETGAGKTTILNGLYNHLCNVKFEDNYRMQLIEKDEAGVDKQSFDSQTEGITGYLFYVQPSMQYKHNIMVIDTPGLNDTRGVLRHTQIMSQMKIFLKDEKYGIIDLHSLAFVVKANLNRCLEYYGKIIEQCIRLFGSDTENITQILKTHAVDRNNNVREIFKKKWNITTENEFNFDNGTLYEPNKVGVKDKFDNIFNESDIHMKKLRWSKQMKECDNFFQILFRMPSVSLQLTRTAIKEKAYLEQAKENLSEKMETVLNYIIANRDNRRMLRDYEMNKKSNKTWYGKETVIEKTRVSLSGERRWYHFAAHAHNCSKCEKTCSLICHIWLPCPAKNSTCLVCNCKNNVHVKSDEIIKETLVIRKVTGKDMEDKFVEAKNQAAELEKYIEKAKKDEETYTQIIAMMIKYVCFLTERLNQVSRIGSTQSAQNITKEIIHDLVQQDKKLIEQLDEDCKSFIRSVFEGIDKIKINKDNWIRELEEIMEYGDSAWGKAKKSVNKTVNATALFLGRSDSILGGNKRHTRLFDINLRIESFIS